MADLEMLRRVLVTVFNEVIDGSAQEAAWLLNPQDVGLLRSLEALSAEQASAIPSNGWASIAAHVDHLRYGLQLLNRWSRGEEPFADADYSASWRQTTVSAAEWAARREELQREAYAWREALQRPRTRSEAPHLTQDGARSDMRDDARGGAATHDKEPASGEPAREALSDDELTGMVASIAHLAYHLGAIRQIDRAMRGPSARD